MTEKKEPPFWVKTAVVTAVAVIATLVVIIIVGALALAATSIWGAVLR